mgnify:CR=1 FL=1
MIVLENAFDETPAMMQRLVKEVASPFFQCSLDIGRSDSFGTMPVSRWIASLGQDLAHIHVHDNNKIYDEHRGLGSGSIPITSFLRALMRCRVSPTVTIEVRTLCAVRQTLALLKRYRVITEDVCS